MKNEPFCQHCGDSGMLTIWSGEAIAKFKAGELTAPRRIAVACSCRRGERYLETCKRWRFDPLRMFPWSGDSEEQRQLLADFLERKREATVAAAAWNPDKYEYPGGYDAYQDH